jgi:uncharacterized membrane-anchored protein
MRNTYVLLLPLMLAAGSLGAQEQQQEFDPEAFNASLKYQSGTVSLRNGLATLNLPEGYRYLDPDQAQRLLVEGWGNPPGDKPLGMIVPAAINPMTDEGWGVIITYVEDGYVKDGDAAKIDYDEMLTEMQTATREGNAERVQAGYSPMELVGWAERPHYDAAAHKLYWARELKVDTFSTHTLNYDVRVLGRQGVLSLNAIAGMQQLPTVQRDMQGVLNFVEFNEGNRYADFSDGDKVAAYGIGALVAGKVAVKAGFFKIVLAALLAGKKFLVIGVIAIAAFLRRLLGGGDKEEPRVAR